MVVMQSKFQHCCFGYALILYEYASFEVCLIYQRSVFLKIVELDFMLYTFFSFVNFKTVNFFMLIKVKKLFI